jgi:hypothetical protein
MGMSAIWPQNAGSVPISGERRLNCIVNFEMGWRASITQGATKHRSATILCILRKKPILILVRASDTKSNLADIVAVFNEALSVLVKAHTDE